MRLRDEMNHIETVAIHINKDFIFKNDSWFYFFTKIYYFFNQEQ